MRNWIVALVLLSATAFVAADDDDRYDFDDDDRVVLGAGPMTYSAVNRFDFDDDDDDDDDVRTVFRSASSHFAPSFYTVAASHDDDDDDDDDRNVRYMTAVTGAAPAQVKTYAAAPVVPTAQVYIAPVVSNSAPYFYRYDDDNYEVDDDDDRVVQYVAAAAAPSAQITQVQTYAAAPLSKSFAAAPPVVPQVYSAPAVVSQVYSAPAVVPQVYSTHAVAPQVYSAPAVVSSAVASAPSFYVKADVDSSEVDDDDGVTFVSGPKQVYSYVATPSVQQYSAAVPSTVTYQQTGVAPQFYTGFQFVPKVYSGHVTPAFYSTGQHFRYDSD